MHDPPTPPGDHGDRPPEASSPLRESVSTATDRIKVIIEAAEKAAAGIIEDAEVQAHRYLEQSRERADHLADQRVRAMSDLTDSLLQQAETVKRQSDGLIAALDSARHQIDTSGRPDLTAPSAGTAPAGHEAAGRGAPHLQPVEPEGPSLQAVPPASPPPVSPQGAPPPVSPQGAPQPPPVSPPPAADPRFDRAAPGASPIGDRPAPPGGRGAFSDGARLLATQMAVAGSSRVEIEHRLRTEFGIEDAAPILDGILGPE
ncbi:MAG: hypothetical protein AABM29_03795 [Actinomycetota bacterium]